MNTVKVRNVEIGAGIPKVCVPIVGSTREEILFPLPGPLLPWELTLWNGEQTGTQDVFDFQEVEKTAKMPAGSPERNSHSLYLPHRERGVERRLSILRLPVALNQRIRRKTGLVDLGPGEHAGTFTREMKR